MLVCWCLLYLSNKLRMIMIVVRIKTMKNRTDETTMREIDSELFVAVVVPVLVGSIVVLASGVVNVNVVLPGGEVIVGSAS